MKRKPKKLFSDDFLRKNVKWVVENRAGEISVDLVNSLMRAIRETGETRAVYVYQRKATASQRKQKIIQVIGEEDLAAVPAVLLSPFGSLVFYGQPKKGLVKIEVNEKVKEKLVKLLIAK